MSAIDQSSTLAVTGRNSRAHNLYSGSSTHLSLSIETIEIQVWNRRCVKLSPEARIEDSRPQYESWTCVPVADQRRQLFPRPRMPGRSEERRVGKECRSRWSP